MNHKELLLATLKGEPTPCIPYLPRLDLWYNANALAGTLPPKYKNATLREITDDLDLGYHAVIPQFRDFCSADGDVDIGLGIYHLRALPYRIELHNVERKVTRLPDGLMVVEYQTAHGTLRTRVYFDDQMKKSGATISVIREHAVKGLDDFKALAYIFKNIEIRPDYSDYEEFRKNVVGHRGLAVVCASVWASPMHYLLKELMSVEDFYFALTDYPDEMRALAVELTPFCDRLFAVAADSQAELVLCGANYDSSVTTPPFFNEFIAPVLKKRAAVLHAQGKYLVTHTDGENVGLLDRYLDSDFDVADSICPAPMTSLTLQAVKEKFAGKISIWGGIPSISVLESSMSQYDFEKYIDQLLGGIGRGDHLIFSIADTTPPAARFDRILYLQKKIKEFGPVKPA